MLCFLGMGLGDTNDLGIEKASAASRMRWPSSRPPAGQGQVAVARGRNVVVIGGGMTAIDAAVQAKLIGAEQ